MLDVIAFLTRWARTSAAAAPGSSPCAGERTDRDRAHGHAGPDRRRLFAMAAAITGGELDLVGAQWSTSAWFAGSWTRWAWSSRPRAPAQVRRERTLPPINVITSPYPGFATDLQSPIMALSCLADGTTTSGDHLRRPVHAGRRAEQDGRQGRGGQRQRGHCARPSTLKGTRWSRTTWQRHRADPGRAVRRGRDRGGPGYLIDRGTRRSGAAHHTGRGHQHRVERRVTPLTAVSVRPM